MGDFGGVIDAVLKGRQYKGAQWNKVPGPYLIKRKFNSRQIGLYVRLAAQAHSGQEFDGETELPAGQTIISTREEAKRERVSEWTVREDLRRLRLAFLINVRSKAGGKSLVTVIDPRFIPAIGGLNERVNSHLAGDELLDIIHEMCMPDALTPRTSSHPPSLEMRKKALLKPLLNETMTRCTLALDLAIEGEPREEFLEQLTRGENSPASAGLVSGEAPPALEIAGLGGPQDARGGPSGPPETERSPSASQAAVGPPKAGEGASGAAGEGETFDLETTKLQKWVPGFLARAKGRVLESEISGD